MNILIEEEQNSQKNNTRLKSNTNVDKKFEYFTNGSRILKTIKKNNLDSMSLNKKLEGLDINKIEAKVTQANVETAEILFQRENNPTLDEFNIPKKNIKEESEIIIKDIMQKQEKEQKDKVQLEKDKKIRHLKNLKNKNKISEYYNKVKEQQKIDFSKLKLSNLKKAKQNKILRIIAIFIILVSIIIILSVLISDGVI